MSDNKEDNIVLTCSIEIHPPYFQKQSFRNKKGSLAATQ